MPIYSYKCYRGHTFELLRDIECRDKDAVCPDCQGLADRIPDSSHFVMHGYSAKNGYAYRNQHVNHKGE